MSKWALLVLLAFAPVCEAAKVTVTAKTPKENTDGTPLTNLAAIIFEWGTCLGVDQGGNPIFGTVQSSIRAQFTATDTNITSAVYPTGMTKVCIRAYAENALGQKSPPSNVASKALLPTTGKPVTLGQPVVLPPDQK